MFRGENRGTEASLSSQDASKKISDMRGKVIIIITSIVRGILSQTSRPSATPTNLTTTRHLTLPARA
ncbi:hypothetical protein HYQ46_003337 [Verticillium longisporum]|nr:hypothetical protein HYQ46_003337 [Verticillium longisporum]